MQKISNSPVKDDISNISDYLRFNAEKYPYKYAILYPDKITYQELDNAVMGYSFSLKHSGIRIGMKTILMIPAGPVFFALAFALFRIGAIPILIDPGMGIRAMAKVFKNLNTEAFIGTPKAHILRLMRPKIFRNIKIKIITRPSISYGRRRYKKYIHDHHLQLPTYRIKAESTAAIFFTSGSTGPAKGVVYTAGMLLNQVKTTKSHFDIGSDETDLCTFPLLGLFALCHGNSSVIADMDMVHPSKLDPAKIFRNINDHNCTQMFGSPMILNKLSKYGTTTGIRIPSLRLIISAGAPVHPLILKSFSKIVSPDAKIHTPYGATEALPVSDITSSELLQIVVEESENATGICIGYPVDPIDFHIIKITDGPISTWDISLVKPVDEIGEIVVKGPWVANEYFNNLYATRLSKIRNLQTQEIWHRMGDLGRIDVKGRLWFYGRKSHRVITESGTLFTIPCEAVYNCHPQVARSALVGITTYDPEIKRAVIIIELEQGFHPSKDLMKELHELGNSSNLTKGISDILFCKKFPVDPRHNAKIFREKLAIWAERRIK